MQASALVSPKAVLAAFGVALFIFIYSQRTPVAAPHAAQDLASPKSTICSKNQFLAAYLPHELEYAVKRKEDWLSSVLTMTDKAYNREMGSYAEIKVHEPPVPERFAGAEPLIACPKIGSFGVSHGRKWICAAQESLARYPVCSIISLGSGGDVSFESALLAAAPHCTVNILDCTVNSYLVPKGAKLHPWCLAAWSEPPSYLTLPELTAKLSVATIPILKMDIEGFEWAIIGTWRRGDPFLPHVLLLELHTTSNENDWGKRLDWVDRSKSHAQVMLLFSHLYRLGYTLAEREVGPGGCPHCAEYTFVLLEC